MSRWKKCLCKAQEFYFRNSFVGYLQRWRVLYREIKMKRFGLKRYEKKLVYDSEKAFGNWPGYLHNKRLEVFAIERYEENLIRKHFTSWSDKVKFSQQGLDFKRARRVYRIKVLKRVFKNMKLRNFPKSPYLYKTGYDLSKVHIKEVFDSLYNDIENKDFIKGKTLANKFWHKNHVPWFFKAWNKLFHKRLKEKNLSRMVLTSRNKQKSRIFFYEWIRRYNISSYKHRKTQQKVQMFQMKWVKYKLVKICKLWIKLYKSKNYYRKLKKISQRHNIIKKYHRCFLRFFILYEKGKINKLKQYKAFRVKDKNLLLKSIHSLVKYFNISIRKKVSFGKAVKRWSMKLYKKIWMILHDKVIRKKYRKNRENDAWNERIKNLTQEGVVMFMKYALDEKNKRDEYIRVLIVNENLRKEKIVKKYAGKWLSYVRNKIKKIHKNNDELKYGDDWNYRSISYRKPPRRHVFL
ncbi:hypothetical protein SteCoe_29328 [Stentor coeruleus]|uniref:Sfi1 spindle body domain-containing protein n=1 Tax=Stentor coeruleus TaxID=5963 RepID=A0A1R2B697_9CILI|nr:hypothetical protein SteCoe_29328 [Stentor coeruleus]